MSATSLLRAPVASLSSSCCDIVPTATPSCTVQKRGPVPRRRFQKGTFVKKPNGSMFSMYYTDAVGPDGSAVTKQVKQFLGNLAQISERAARREHAQIMEPDQPAARQSETGTERSDVCGRRERVALCDRTKPLAGHSPAS
jgi:hypothetical protein